MNLQQQTRIHRQKKKPKRIMKEYKNGVAFCASLLWFPYVLSSCTKAQAIYFSDSERRLPSIIDENKSRESCLLWEIRGTHLAAFFQQFGTSQINADLTIIWPM